jgi:hypothetical protein
MKFNSFSVPQFRSSAVLLAILSAVAFGSAAAPTDVAGEVYGGVAALAAAGN